MHLIKSSIAVTLVSLMGAGIFMSCNKKPAADTYVKKVGMVWNTTYHITYQGSESLTDSITATLSEVGKSLSFFDTESTVSHINSNTSKEVDAHFIKVFATAERIHRESHGAFDPTLGPVITAWGFGKGHAPTADTARLDSIRKFVGLEKISISDKGTVEKLDSRVQLNFSAIAKGYGCDAVAAMLKRNGVDNYMIEIGGEIAVGGKSPRGGEWVIAIEKPEFDNARQLPSIAEIKLNEGGLATSGNYRNFSTDTSGLRFGHTINPKTCRPAATDVLSATVIAPTCMEADAYATSFMVLGMEDSKAMADSLQLPAMLVLSTDSIWISDAMKKYIVKGS